VLGFPISVQQ